MREHGSMVHGSTVERVLIDFEIIMLLLDCAR